MGSEIGAVAIKAGHRVAGEVGDGDDSGVLLLILSRHGGVDLRGDPRGPGPAIHEGVPGIVGGMVGLHAFLKASRDGAYDAWVFGFDVIDREGI